MPFLNAFIAGSNLFCAIIAIALALPLVRRRVKMNRTYGIRFARSFESEELWYAINEYGGRRLIVWSVVLAVAGLAGLFLPLEGRPVVIGLFAFAPLLLVVPVAEAYRYAKKL